MRPHHLLGLGVAGLVISTTFGEVRVEGVEHLSDRPRTLYISTHDDIIREAGLIYHAVGRLGLPLPAFAIGDNLSENRLLAPLLTLAPTFPVPRERGKGPEIADAIEAELSRGRPVWVAQNRGRTKDGSHRTSASMLRNLFEAYRKAGRRRTIDEYIAETRIIPVAVSAEYDPAAPIVVLAEGEGKGRWDDFWSVAKGMWWPKRATYGSVCPPVSGHFREIGELREAIDDALRIAYPLFETHRAAYVERGTVHDEWLTSPIRYSMLPSRLRRQVKSLPEKYRPALVARYAMPAYERAMAEEKLAWRATRAP